MLLHILCHSKLYTCGNEEILLFESQFLTRIMVIVGIEDFTDRLGQVLLLNRLVIITLVKRIELEAVDSLGIPDPLGIYEMIVISDNRKIIRYGKNRLAAFLNEALPALYILYHSYISAELDQFGVILIADLERITVFEPVIGLFNLKTVLDLLLEHAVFITDAAADSRITQSCK